jgi:hypothetical protein
MPEVGLDFPRAWVEFPDPDEPINHLYRLDLTWLTSNWTCIFGRGCQGIYEDRPDDGCCTQGAHFTDHDDEQRVRNWAKKLTKKSWQYYDEAQPARKNGALNVIEPDPDGEPKTRVVDGACIFLNRPGFAGGEGCSLHHLAESKGVHFVKTKPDVCWQLPIRRSYESIERPDGVTMTVEVIGEFDRRGWGEGGADFDWYCTSNSEAHIGDEPVYLSNKAEFIEMMGKKGYAEMVRHCEAHLAAQQASRKRLLPLLTLHPATKAAQDSGHGKGK